jgi:hypothetical protein
MQIRKSVLLFMYLNLQYKGMQKLSTRYSVPDKYCGYKLDIHGSMHHDVLTKITKKMQLCRIIYYFLAALYVTSDIFAHHQEHLNCIYGI